MIGSSPQFWLRLTRRACSGASLSLALLLSCSCNSGNASEVLPVNLPFDAQRAWADLETMVAFGPRPSGSDAAEETRIYIEEQLRELGLEPKREPFTDQTPAGKIAFCNLYADFAGRPTGEKPAHIVFLATHFDTKRMDELFVGANDGGSSTACVLELARAIVAGGQRDLTYRFLFLDGEEAVREYWEGKDNTYGSRHHARQLQRSADYDLVKACVLLDMIGDKHLRIWRDTNSSQDLQQLFISSARELGLAKHMSGPRQAVNDDHLSFMKVGIPSVDLIDLDYGPESKDNSWWHTTQDTLDKCSAKSLEITGKIVLATLPKLEAKYRRQR